MQPVIFATIAIILYLATSAALAARLRYNNSERCLPRTGVLLLGVCGAMLHATVLFPGLITNDGLDLRFFNAASLAALITIWMLLLTALSKPVENLGIPLFPTAALSIALAVWYPKQQAVISTNSLQLDLHILLSMLAYCMYALAAVQAILMAIQERHLRNRRPGGFIRALAPLEAMENLLFQMIASGFALLTTALLTGIVFLEDIFAQHLVHKTVLSIIGWMIFATLLWGRWQHGWRGRTAIRWTLWGFSFLLLAYFGSKLVLELILGRTT